MLRVFTPYFWICLLIFTANQLLEKAGVHIPLVHSYLDDLLCPGIVLGFALFVQQRFSFRNPHYTFGPGPMLFFIFWYALLFEVLFPMMDARHHPDIWDVVAYSIGTLGFARWGNKKSRSGAFVSFLKSVEKS